jgi:hypothetical protein
MDAIFPTLPLAALRVLGALARFEPHWSVSGRAALWWWLRRVPPLIGQLDFVWHGLGDLGALHGRVVRTLADADLDVATLYGDSRRIWLGAGYCGSTCLLSLTAEPGPLLEPPQEARLAGVEVAVDGLREVVAAILCSLHKRLDRQGLENAGLLVRHRVSLNRGLEDACDRNPDLVPLDLALRVAHFDIDDPELSEITLGRLRRYQEQVVFKILACSGPRPRASWRR